MSLSQLSARVVEALRHELHQYGEMLALLDQQQEAVMVRAADEVMKSVVGIHQQMAAIGKSRVQREAVQAEIALQLGEAADATFEVLIPLFPGKAGVGVAALVAENNDLLRRVQRRARQNHLLLSRSVELMQQFMNALVPASQPKTYNDGGRLEGGDKSAHRLYEAVG